MKRKSRRHGKDQGTPSASGDAHEKVEQSGEISAEEQKQLKFISSFWLCGPAPDKISAEQKEQLKLISEYVKFHIAIYLATPPVLIIIAQGLNVEACAPWLAGLCLMILAFIVSGVSAGLFMGAYINTEWDDVWLADFYEKALGERRKFMHHGLYWVGLAVGLIGLVVAAAERLGGTVCSNG